ncbi:AraC family transcriptional regulator [Neorhizobium sp. BETTINA12A]|uniref:AraC family transcriptional regulator n=1 Tax=Neorhizobium sp. BETTINA12A TaxID=2908924 RepID=UPI001FF15093|nr:AraC family transcriptional regulator [Neorhizobium sp. BETTINA12A]MCJ9751405.1 AraC family transcriptional regulator [Neorhizobium sp. BETTINA12A]
MYPTFIDDVRRENGFLTIGEIGGLVSKANIVFDPFSVLISRYVEIGTGNTFYPCVTILCAQDADLAIADGNTFHSNSLFEATAGKIVIGSSNQFGEGGFTAKANREGALISFGDNGRYINGCSVFGHSSLGSGSQIIGAIAVDSCSLEAGASYRDPEPDRRAALLKGFGPAKGLTVPVGAVINGKGSFLPEAIERQSNYHPKV